MNNFEIFPGKDLSGLFEDIYKNQTNKKQKRSHENESPGILSFIFIETWRNKLP